jgi:hypothetical protein
MMVFVPLNTKQFPFLPVSKAVGNFNDSPNDLAIYRPSLSGAISWTQPPL